MVKQPKNATSPKQSPAAKQPASGAETGAEAVMPLKRDDEGQLIGDAGDAGGQAGFSRPGDGGSAGVEIATNPEWPSVQAEALPGNVSGLLLTNSPVSEAILTGNRTTPVTMLTDEVRAAFPALAAALERWGRKHGSVAPTAMRITSAVEGFWRGGRVHSRAPAEHQIEEFTPIQLDRILAEPNLVVELI